MPFVVDYNEDHKKDLLVGAGDGTLNLFINQGTDSQPAFHPLPDRVVLTFGNSLSPFVVTDWNADGKKDLLIGNGNGHLYLYLNGNTNEDPVFGAGQAIAGATGALNVGTHSTPFAVDFNEDGLTDLLTGNGLGEVTLFLGAEAKVTVDLHIMPETLNRRSRGQWISANIGFPEGHDARTVDGASLRLNGVVPAEASPVAFCESGSCRGVEVKFDRAQVQSILPLGDRVQITVTGRIGTENFEGVDVIRVLP